MKYDFDLSLNKNNSLSLIINRVKDNSKVLEFGCANGRLTKFLNEEKNCTITIVELDEEAGKDAERYASRCFLGDSGDIESFSWAYELNGEKFDYIIFSDVLEHLRDPEKVLNKCKDLLARSGSVLVSIPNIANNSILTGLFKNEFEYQNVGLLDNTHIKFYTYNTFKRMLGRLDYKMVYETGTYNKIGENEIDANLTDLPCSMRKEIIKRPFGDVYQFVFEFKNVDYDDESCFALTSLFPDTSSHYYESVCYLIKEGEVSEFNTVRNPVKLGLNNVRLNVLNSDSLRFDPVNSNAIIKVHKIVDVQHNRNCGVISTNAKFHIDNFYFFTSDDPNFMIEIPEGSLEIEIVYEVLDYDYSITQGETVLLSFVEGTTAEKNTMRMKIEECEENTKCMQNKIQDQGSLIESQSQMLTSNNTDILKLNKDIEMLRKEIEQLRKGTESIESEKSILENERNNLMERVNKYNNRRYRINKI